MVRLHGLPCLCCVGFHGYVGLFRKKKSAPVFGLGWEFDKIRKKNHLQNCKWDSFLNSGTLIRKVWPENHCVANFLYQITNLKLHIIAGLYMQMAWFKVN